MLSKHIKDSHGLKWHIRFITPLGDLLGTTSSQIGVGMCRINVLKWLNPNWVVIMSLVCQLQILCGILWAISNKIFILAVTVMSILSHYAASCTEMTTGLSFMRTTEIIYVGPNFVLWHIIWWMNFALTLLFCFWFSYCIQKSHKILDKIPTCLAFII